MRRDYSGSVTADYERRWRTFNATVRTWVLARWPDGLRPNARVLDLGCGTGEFLGTIAAVHPLLELTGLDLTPALLAEARRRAPRAYLIEGDADAPPFRAKSFAVVCSLNVLHHLNDHRHHIAMLERLCQPGGSIFLCTFAGGRTLGMRAADIWLRRRNPAWVGMRSTAELSRCLAGTAQLAVVDRDELRAGFWRLQIYRLTKRSTAR